MLLASKVSVGRGQEDVSGTVTIRLKLHGHLCRAGVSSQRRLAVRPRLDDAWVDLIAQVDGLEDALARGSCVILVNGANLHRLQARSPKLVELTEGDLIEVLPFVAGGGMLRSE